MKEFHDHSCRECGWCHDFGAHGYCQNQNVKKNELNKLTYEELVTTNECPYYDDDTWFGG